MAFEAAKRCVGWAGERKGEEPAYDALNTWLSESVGRALPPAFEVVAGTEMADSFAAAALAASETSDAAGSGERNWKSGTVCSGILLRLIKSRPMPCASIRSVVSRKRLFSTW